MAFATRTSSACHYCSADLVGPIAGGREISDSTSLPSRVCARSFFQVRAGPPILKTHSTRRWRTGDSVFLRLARVAALTFPKSLHCPERPGQAYSKTPRTVVLALFCLTLGPSLFHPGSSSRRHTAWGGVQCVFQEARSSSAHRRDTTHAPSGGASSHRTRQSGTRFKN